MSTKSLYGKLWDKMFYPRGLLTDQLGSWFWVEIPTAKIRYVSGKWMYVVETPTAEHPYR